MYNFPPQPLYFWLHNILATFTNIHIEYSVHYWQSLKFVYTGTMYHQFLILKYLFSSPIELVRFVEETRLLFSMACPQLRPLHPQTKIKERRKISLKELVFTSFNTKSQKIFEKKNRISLWCKPPREEEEEKKYWSKSSTKIPIAYWLA